MSTSGARGPGLPPKPAAPLAPKVATPAAPPVVAKPVAPAVRPRLESNAAMSPGGAKVLVAAHVVEAPHTADDDAWDEVATKIEPVAAKPSPPAQDVQAIVKAALDEALGPIGDAFLRLERRVLELERRAATTAAAPPAPVVAPPSPTAPAVPATVALSPLAPAPPRPVAYAPRPSDLVVDAAPLADFENPFDGKRRRRRVATIFVLLILIGFGTPLGILIASYMR